MNSTRMISLFPILLLAIALGAVGIWLLRRGL